MAQLNLTALDKRSTHAGFVKAEISFIDESVLYVREFVDVENADERLMYVYQYVDSSGHLIFRYDSTGHHKKLMLPTYPHHKHDRAENAVVATPPVNLDLVLQEIEELVLSSV